MTTIESAAYEAQGQSGSPVELKDRCENFIGGDWIAPTTGEYRENVTPSTGEPFCEVAYSGAADIELALDAAHAAKDAWGRRSPAERAAVLNAVADGIDENLEMLAVAESYDNGKPVRETLAAGFLCHRITFATSPALCDPRRGGSRRSTSSPTPTTSTSRWAWWVRSSRSISRC
jgi:acyl-CoA reductase-like NAD-dependent aldehyde dehydrogenase